MDASKLLSKGETAALCSILDSSTIDSRVALLSTMAQAVGSKGINLISSQLKNSSGDYSIAMTGFDIPLGEITAEQIKIDERAEYGTIAEIANVIAEDPKSGVRALGDDPKAAAMVRQMARGIYAYNSKARIDSSAEKCVAESVGGKVYTHNKRKIVLPRGIDGSSLFGEDFGNLINRQAGTIRNNSKETYYFGGNTFTPQMMADKLRDMDLKTESVSPDGSVTYSVQKDGIPVFKSDGKLYTFTLSGKKEK